MEIKDLVLVVIFVSTINMVEVRMATLPDVKFSKLLDGHTFRRLINISVNDCWMNCEHRAACLSVNYQRHTRLCELKSVANETALKNEPFFMYIEKKTSTSSVECGKAMCNISEVCDIQTNQCVIKECQPLKESESISIIGNLLVNGSSVRIRCKPGFRSSHEQESSVRSVCQNGKWSRNLECIK